MAFSNDEICPMEKKQQAQGATRQGSTQRSKQRNNENNGRNWCHPSAAPRPRSVALVPSWDFLRYCRIQFILNQNHARRDDENRRTGFCEHSMSEIHVSLHTQANTYIYKYIYIYRIICNTHRYTLSINHRSNIINIRELQRPNTHLGWGPWNCFDILMMPNKLPN